MNRVSLAAAIAVLGVGFSAQPTFAQQVITCEVIANASGLSVDEQRALGAAAAARVAELRDTDAAAADVLQECVANAQPEILAGFQDATTGVGDVDEVTDQREHTKQGLGQPGTPPAGNRRPVPPPASAS